MHTMYTDARCDACIASPAAGTTICDDTTRMLPACDCCDQWHINALLYGSASWPDANNSKLPFTIRATFPCATGAATAQLMCCVGSPIQVCV